jgi:hypothetical protein
MPSSALQGSRVTLNVYGIPFAPSATFYLARTGHGDILPTDVTWVSTSQLTGTVDLGAAALGSWTAVISNPPSLSVALPDAFLVASDQLFLPLVVKNVSP